VALIYNPNSGKRRDVKTEITKVLSESSIFYQIFETKGPMDGWRIVQNLDLDNYSALIAVGGDGTLHEVLNGLMFRSDKKKLPIALVPNGSGNDTCTSIGIH